MDFKKISIPLLFSVLISCHDNNDDSKYILNITSFPNREQDFSLWQLDGLDQVQMGYIIRTDDNKIIVVDGGLPESEKLLTPYLKQLNGEVDTWIITHPHADHAGALLEIIIKRQIKIKKILHVALQEEWVRLHETQSLSFFSSYSSIIDNSKIPLIGVSDTDTFLLGEGVEMKVLGASNENITVNAINNSSMVFKIVSQSKSILFLGDLGPEGGDAILKGPNAKEIQVNYVQMAHHGQSGVNKLFYELVNADYALWPTPIWLWDNIMDNKGPDTGKWKTLIVRQWMDDLNIKKNFVVGIEGTIQID